ncbi:MAG: DUF1573 domain-containing protein [Bacteroidetes bacterium]|nr:DUF1573 domain-containing protein [Bacteroidota bacterium]
MNTRFLMPYVVAGMLFIWGCGNEPANQEKTEKNAQATTATESSAHDTDGPAETTTPGEQPADPTTAPSGPARIQFDRTSHNFGTHKVGDSVFTFFNFKNLGSEPLEITNAKPSCSCTGVQYPKGQTFGLGEGGKIRIAYPTKDKVGFNAKNVLVFTNADKTPVKLSFQLEVEE